jgi:Protein of unknown function (DUF3505).
MLNVNDYIIYIEKYQVVLCRSCKYCLQPNGIFRHFQTEHKAVPMPIRKMLIDYTKGLELVAPAQVSIPNIMIPEIEGLNVMKGCVCKSCFYLCGTEHSMRGHCRITHGCSLIEGMSQQIVY